MLAVVVLQTNPPHKSFWRIISQLYSISKCSSEKLYYHWKSSKYDMMKGLSHAYVLKYSIVFITTCKEVLKSSYLKKIRSLNISNKAPKQIFI